MEEWDWDLQAVVRGCRGRSTEAARDPLSSFSPSLLILQEQDGFAFQGKDEERGHGRDIFCFPNLLGPTESSTEELVKLYRPFFPKLSSSCLASSPPPLQKTQIQQWQSPRSPSAVSLLQTGGFTPAKQEQQRPPVSTQVTPTTTRSKRRKNQQKRVVCRVPTDGLSSDMWAWRKYGQKPIKGSPYPRGYYRCSSSKGCLARKQVEICRTDPGVFVITYTAEHNHPVPTHRNTLAGSIRHKFPQSNSPSSTTTTKDYNDNHVNCGQMGENIVLTSSNPMSPTTPLTSSMGEEELLHPMKKEGGGEEVEEEEEEEDEEGMLLVTDMEMLGEDDVVFLGLEDLNQSSPGDHFPSNWRTVTTTGET